MKITIGLKDGSIIYAETLQEEMIHLKPLNENDWLVTKDTIVPYSNIRFIKRIEDKKDIVLDVGNIKQEGLNVNDLMKNMIETSHKMINNQI
ncbi:hypothetical protein [Brevibacillus laterosporus]|uniref:Uncharacterized protein n=1 Tax=Brevibacillus laterosporus TaxID=1465 RepID=A0AAP8QI78_BRELA|nr:hypothetical protein [Brevibacillus laterosporus]PPB12983.1 hypothetical protein C4A77_00940 [Brevibacillus laterosporus]